MLTEELKKKIHKVWNMPNRRYNGRLFSAADREFMGCIPKFIWDYFNDTPVCICKNAVLFKSLLEGYKPLCRSCIKIQRNIKYKATMKERYGVISVFQIKEIQQRTGIKASSKISRDKAQATATNNGTHQNTDYHKNKVKETKIRNWGHSGYVNRGWSTGNLYEKLGFKFINNTAPNYFYFFT